VSDAPLLAECSDGVLALTLNRPDKRNALSRAVVDALHDALDQAELDAAARVVTLAGAGRDFCAGADLAELLASADRTLDENEAEAFRLGEIFLKLRRLPKPVVALVRGNALAGGCGLATACDLVLAAQGARFGYPEIQRGFVPAMVLTLLRRIVGERVAFDLVGTGRVLSATEAHALGLVSRVLADERFEAESAQVVAALAQTSGTALALTKQLLYELDGRSIDDGIRLGARVNALARATPDFRERIAQFLHR
jgi:methylglutaconyl-CoA hydratase